MPEKRYTKVEEEVLQILDKMDVDFEEPTRPPLRLVSKPRRRPVFDRLRSIRDSPWLSLGATTIFAFAAIIVSNDSHLLATIFASLSILAFLSPIAYRRPGSAAAIDPTHEAKLWRGRDITLGPPSTDSRSHRARRWFDRQRGGDS